MMTEDQSINIKDSDATIIFGNVNSLGSRMTRNFCIELHKPLLVNPTIPELQTFIDQNSLKILNIAGNRESKNPGIQTKVRGFLVSALRS